VKKTTFFADNFKIQRGQGPPAAPSDAHAFDMVQSHKSGRFFGPDRVGPGSGLSLSKYFEPISSLHAKLFMTSRATTFFFCGLDFLCSPR